MNLKTENIAIGPTVFCDLSTALITRKHHGRTILMLEDDDTFSELFGAYLDGEGFTVDRVPNGTEGLKKIIATDFDVIICDMMMPHFPGDMFYLAVSRTKPHLLKRFIFMTGYQGDRKVTDFISRIRGVVLWKPFQFCQMTERIEAVLATSVANPTKRAA
jgi:DNA-binding response OmpR family regulator